MRLSAIQIHPVKSCRGLSVPSATVDAWGLVGDRRFMIVAEDGGLFLTQRTHPRLALIETDLTADSLILSSPRQGSVTIPLQASFGLRRVTVWRSTVTADDCGEEPAGWLSDFLGLPLRLVRMGGAFQRPVTKPAAQPGDVVGFADSCPFLVVGEASLADLNARLDRPVPMNRFRPNLVIAGSEPHAENDWTRISLGGIVLRSAGPCARCVITTTDQLTAVRRAEPLRTLATYRRDPVDHTNVNFGANFIHETKYGTLRVDTPVILL